MFAHAFNIINKVFGRDGKVISRVGFIQEKKGGTIEEGFHSKWHHHRLHQKGDVPSSIVVLADNGSTEFADGVLEVDGEKMDIHDQALAALTPGVSLTSKTLPSGKIAHFNKNTIHRRGPFLGDDPRVVLIVEYND